MSERGRRRSFAIVATGCIVLSGAYFAWAALRADSKTAAASSPSLIRAIAARPFVLFLTSETGRAPFDRAAIASLEDPRQRALLGFRCNRVAMTGDAGMCVRHSVRFGAFYEVSFFDRSFRPGRPLVGFGIPSRARVSPSGRTATVTSFDVGHSYRKPGAFSTRATIFAPGARRPLVETLEQFRVRYGGRRFEPEDRNFWGVTFVDDRLFYATMAAARKTYLVRGDLRARLIRIVRRNAECPSVSPDGSRVAYKRRAKDGRWRFTVLHLRTGREVPLRELRNLDDQLAWVDSSHVAYGDGRDVWVMSADGAGRPRRLLEGAESPTIVRSAQASGAPTRS